MKITPQFLIVSFFNLLILSVPLYFRFENEELFEFNKMILVYALTICISFLWIVRMIFEKKVILKRTPLDYPVAFFVFSQLVSTIFSIHPYTSLFGYYSRFNGGFLSTIAYVVLFYAFVSNVKKKDIGGFFLSAFVSGLIVSIYGILEHFGHSISCLFVPGNRSFGVDCWVQDVQSRVYATFGQPNWLAAYVITLLPISLVAATQKNLSIARRVLFICTLLALFLVLLYTRSRSGIVGLAGGAITFLTGTVILFGKNRNSFWKKIHLPTAVGVIVAVFAIALINGTGLTPSIFDILRNQRDTQPAVIEQNTEIAVDRLEGGGTDSGEIRKIVWTGALKVWQRYPIIGSGVETFAYSYYQDRIREHNDVSEWDFLYNKAHNELLNIMANTGTIGILTYLSVYFVLTLITIRIFFSPKYTQTEKLIVLALFSGQVALFISNFFGFSTVGVNVLMYIFFAITCVVYANEVDEKMSANTKGKKLTIVDGSQYFGITLVAVIALFLLFKTYNYWAADKAYAEGKNYFSAGQYEYGIQKQLEAIARSPKEALFYDTLGDNYAKLAAHFATINEATAAAQIANETVAASNKTLELNDRHLNFYKTRARIMVTLSQLDERFIDEAKLTLLEAMKLAPTDPKLVYTLAVIEHTDGNTQTAMELYQQALELKPNYERALWKVSEIYESQEKYAEALQPLEYILKNITPGNEELIKKIESLKKNLDNQK